MAKKILLLASGAGSLAQALFDSPLPDRADFVGLISDKDSLALERARLADVPAFHLPMLEDRSEWDKQLFSLALTLAPDIVVSVGFMRILSPDFVHHFKVMNTHPALLPAFPGAHAVRDALKAGVTETGTNQESATKRLRQNWPH